MIERFHFSAWTVAQRELREGARRWANYRLRVLSGLAGAGLLWLSVINDAYRSMGQIGSELFERLHCLMLILIFAIVPGMAADCIARERREGTLGLLFLTPLTARGVVVGKSMAQVLRALTLWLAMLPVLTVPFLTGGVTRDFAVDMMTIEFCTAVICIAGGLAASALAKSRGGAFFLAYALAAMALTAVAVLNAGVRWHFFGPGGQPPSLGNLLTDGIRMATGEAGYSRQMAMAVTAMRGFPSVFTQFPRLGTSFWMAYLGTSIVASGLLAFLAIILSAAAIQRLWKDRIASVRQQNLWKRFCTPLFRRQYHRQTQWTLDLNPIAWLQQYSWKARASKWGLCGAFILMESSLLSHYDDIASIGHSEPLQALLTFVLAAVFTFVGVSGFLEEKRSGALELLLVTPVSVNRIIMGRACGLWLQFLPAASILALGFIAASTFDGWSSPHWALGRGRGVFISEGAFVALFVCANVFIALPIFATYCALRVKNLIAAAALTWVGLFVAWIFVECLTDNVLAIEQRHMISPWETPVLCSVTLLCNAALVALTFFLLRHSLSRRIYAF